MISPEELVLRLEVAAILGALVGLERLEWAAGMRTHALVSLGSALFMVVSIFGGCFLAELATHCSLRGSRFSKHLLGPLAPIILRYSPNLVEG